MKVYTPRSDTVCHSLSMCHKYTKSESDSPRTDKKNKSIGTIIDNKFKSTNITIESDFNFDILTVNK